jgi:hypothetical protein
VHEINTQRTPRAAYCTTVAAPFDDSSSGCACTDTKHRRRAIAATYVT